MKFITHPVLEVIKIFVFFCIIVLFFGYIIVFSRIIKEAYYGEPFMPNSNFSLNSSRFYEALINVNACYPHHK